MSRKFVVQKLKIASILLVILLMGTGLIGDKTKIKYHTQQIIKLADSDLGLIKEYPAYKVPDLSRLRWDISKDWVRLLWSNFFNPKSIWTTWDEIYNHGRKVMGFSHEQMIEIGEALGFLEEQEDPPLLVIKYKKLYFRDGGTKPFFGVGISRRELLCRADGYHGGLHGKPLRFFEDITIEYGLNFVRHDATRNIGLLRNHLQYMYENKIVVELTLWDGHERPEMGNPKEIIEATKDFKNVIYDPVNELYSEEDVKIAKDLCRYIKDKDLICSAGAFGTGGQKWSGLFDPFNSENDIIGVHRGSDDDGDYDPKHLEKYRDSDKPFMRTEIHHKSVEEVMRIMRDDFEMESSVENYYGLRCNELFPDLVSDPNLWREYFEAAGQLCKKLNQ